MKKIILTLITAVTLIAAVLSISSCSKSQYDEFDEQGYTVSVRFDANGGTFKGSDSTIVDLFNPREQSRIKLLPPDDERRGDNVMTVTKPECMLAGWYATRTPIDENDLSKGYTYSDRWDFEKDTLNVSADGNYTSATPTLTLYAAWIPYFTFEYYTESGEMYATTKGTSITVPSWVSGETTIKMGKFPERDGYTLLAAYSDPECKNAISGRYEGKWDVETASVESPTIKIYTKWDKGTHYRIYTADQLRKNADVEGIYTIMNDLDFKNVRWPAKFKDGKFKGAFIGNGHKISNITIESEYISAPQNGLFSSIDSTASFSDITFENLIHEIKPKKFVQGARFGLLAGTVSENATFNNVTVKGNLVFDKGCESFKGKTDYSIYLLSGCGRIPDGITYDIDAFASDEVQGSTAPLFTVRKENNEVILEFPDNN